MALSNHGLEYRYNPKGEYHNRPANTQIRFRKRTNLTTDPKFGKVCKECHMTLPRNGVCGNCE